MSRHFLKYSKDAIIKEIHDHTINKKKSEGILSNVELQDILKVLGREDIKIMDELTYYKLAIHNNEPKQAILFITCSLPLSILIGSNF